MRMYIKRLAFVLLGGFGICFLIFVIPSSRYPSEDPRAGHSHRHDGFVNNGPKDFDKNMAAYIHRRKLAKEKSGSLEGHLPPKQEPFNDVPQGHLSEWMPDPNTRKTDNVLVQWIQNFLTPWDGVDVKRLECKTNQTLGHTWEQKYKKQWPILDSFDQFYYNMGTCDLYRDWNQIRQLLSDIATMPIKHTAVMDGGTQIKLVITYENGKQSIMKPMRFGRGYETDPNHFYFSDFERHHAEIAAFHLDRVLGLRHSVPVVGRVVNMSSELRDHADRSLAKTFFISPAKNLCFVGKCDYYCDTTHAICGKPDLKEGSFQLMLPDEDEVPRDHNRSPYRRTYSKKTQLAEWQKDPTYCDYKVKKKAQFAHGRRLLDVVELYIFDFLQGNQDRHHFETMGAFKNIEAYPVYLDNGRGWGRPSEDDLFILSPLTQCCVIRPSFLRTLLNYYTGPTTLSQALYASLSEDPVSPILHPKHYVAVERRLDIILRTVYQCVEKNGGDASKVIMTEYHNPDVPENQGDEETEEED